MARTDRNDHDADDTGPQDLDPRDTDNPTGSQQADENQDNESPS
jgi:hypothetical protein